MLALSARSTLIRLQAAARTTGIPASAASSPSRVSVCTPIFHQQTVLPAFSAARGKASMASGSTFTVPPIAQAPKRSLLVSFPGFTAEAGETARRIIDDNHKRFHIFFNESGFHNHLSHHILASLTLGLPPGGLEAIYAKEREEFLKDDFYFNKKPAKLVPPGSAAAEGKDESFGKHGGTLERIDESNWTEHLGDNAFYWPYLVFFQGYVEEHGAAAALEKFIFSEQSNGDGLHMLARFIGGAIHPLIHVGYGMEFGLPGIVAEGITMAALTETRWSAVFPEKIGDLAPLVQASRSATDRAAERLSAIKLSDEGALSPSKPRAGLSLLSILDLIAQDAELAPNAAVKHSDGNKTASGLRKAAPILLQKGYFDLWQITEQDVQDPTPVGGMLCGGWMDKWEELVWLSVLLLGATSKPGAKEYKHDFFLMHVNNATLFMPALLAPLKPRERAQLLHAFFRASVQFWISRGRPAFHIASTLNKSTDAPYNPNMQVSFGSAAVVDPAHRQEGKQRGGGSPWFDLLQAASVHMDEHQTKAVRSLSYFSQSFGDRAAGSFCVDGEAVQAEMKKRGLDAASYKSVFEGLDQLDGTAFIRTAGQLMVSQGWARDEHENRWNYDGLGFPEAWE